MPSMNLTKSAIDSARPGTRDYEIRDTIAPGFFCKVTPAGRKVFMLSYRTPSGERRKPSLGTYGQITVDQARKLALDFLASVRGGADPSQERQVTDEELTRLYAYLDRADDEGLEHPILIQRRPPAIWRSAHTSWNATDRSAAGRRSTSSASSFDMQCPSSKAGP